MCLQCATREMPVPNLWNKATMQYVECAQHSEFNHFYLCQKNGQMLTCPSSNFQTEATEQPPIIINNGSKVFKIIWSSKATASPLQQKLNVTSAECLNC